MKIAIRGILASDPELQVIPGPDGREYRGVNARLLYKDDRPGAGFGECQLIAWNDQADALMNYKANDELDLSCRLNASPSANRLSLTLLRIDETKTLVSATEKFIDDFTPPKVPLMEQIHRAEQQKAAAEAQGKQPAKEAIQ